MWVYNNMKSSLYFCLLNIFGQRLTLHWQTWLSQGSKLDIFVFQLFSVWLQRQLAGSLLVSAPASDAVVHTCIEEGHLKAQRQSQLDFKLKEIKLKEKIALGGIVSPNHTRTNGFLNCIRYKDNRKRLYTIF